MDQNRDNWIKSVSEIGIYLTTVQLTQSLSLVNCYFLEVVDDLWRLATDDKLQGEVYRL